MTEIKVRKKQNSNTINKKTPKDKKKKKLC